MNPISLKTFHFILSPKQALRLPEFAGATLRGGFGYAFRQITCALRRAHCSDCLLRETCPYAYVFETPRPSDSKLMRLYPTVPHPFVFNMAQNGHQILAADSYFPLDVTLIGQARRLLPHFIYAFKQLGERGLGKEKVPFDLVNVETRNEQGNIISVYHPKRNALESCDHSLSIDIWEPVSQAPDELTIEIQSPMRVKSEGKLCNDLPFKVLVTNLLRRASSLAYFHCDIDMREMPFRSMIEEAAAVQTTHSSLEWRELSRYSTRQKQRMNLGGLSGTVTYKGDFRPFVNLLRLGEVIHVGKNTSFGLGHFQMVSDHSTEGLGND